MAKRKHLDRRLARAFAIWRGKMFRSRTQADFELSFARAKRLDDACAKKVGLATKCQAMWRGKMSRRRTQAFADWDLNVAPNVAPESGVWEEGPRKGEPCPLRELPLKMLLIDQDFTPLGLRLARQLFLLFDQNQDDRWAHPNNLSRVVRLIVGCAGCLSRSC
eukprot:COSAG02_NODE_23976_length_702_cov_0.862355_1_plen_162_part_10